MSDGQASSPCQGKRETRIEWTAKYGDTLYELFVSKCADCDGLVCRLLRTSGASISVYQISAEDFENQEEYVEALHESFATDVETKLVQLRNTVAEFNSRGLFEAEGVDVFHVRLIDLPGFTGADCHRRVSLEAAAYSTKVEQARADHSNVVQS